MRCESPTPAPSCGSSLRCRPKLPKESLWLHNTHKNHQIPAFPSHLGVGKAEEIREYPEVEGPTGIIEKKVGEGWKEGSSQCQEFQNDGSNPTHSSTRLTAASYPCGLRSIKGTAGEFHGSSGISYMENTGKTLLRDSVCHCLGYSQQPLRCCLCHHQSLTTNSIN